MDSRRVLNFIFYLLFSSCLVYKFLNLVVVVTVGKQLLYRHMHAISPVVFRIGWDVYTFGVSIGKAYALVYGKPVLQREYAQH